MRLFRSRGIGALSRALVSLAVMLAAILLVPTHAQAVVAEGTCGTCEWSIDDDGVLTIGAGTLASNDEQDYEFWPWRDYRESIKEIRTKGAVVGGKSMSGCFSWSGVTSVDLRGLDTSHVTDMSEAFSYCESLTTLDLTSWNTSRVTEMNSMFSGCSSLRSLDVSTWNTSQVVSMPFMFGGCSSLTSIDLSGWDTSHVTEMGDMFASCSSLTSLDLSSWNTSRVENMRYMFSDCSSLQSLDLTGWDASKVTEMWCMFEECSSLSDLKISSMNPSRALSIGNMFYGCSSLTSLDLSAWDISQIKGLDGLFSGCSSLSTLNISGWNPSSATSMGYMFSGCSSLTFLDLSDWDTSQVEYMNGMFSGCSSLATLDLSRWNTSKVKELCSRHEDYDYEGDDEGDPDTGEMIIDGMFEGCSSLASLDLSGWDVSQVEDLGHLFNGCTSLEDLDLSGWDTSQVEYVDGMFYDCSSLSRISVGEGYGMISSDSFPDPTCAEGWWSNAEGKWLSKDEIISDRSNTADTYTSYTSKDISSALVVTIAEQTYTGKAIEPAVSVTLGGVRLAEGVDYEVSYADNVEVGTATATITGRGNYTGTKSVTFRIVPAEPFFLDATPGDERNHGTEVDWMGRSGISTGWDVPGGREFRGMRDVKRCDFAAFLYRMADLSDDGSRNDSCALSAQRARAVLAGVSDCSPSTSHAPEIAWMIDEGISRGWGNADGTVSFRPMANVARQDMAAFLYRYADIQDDGRQDQSLEPGAESVAFRDVRHGDAANHADEVEWLGSVGVTKGWQVAGGKYEFRGRNNVKRQDMAAFLYRLNAYLNG